MIKADILPPTIITETAISLSKLYFSTKAGTLRCLYEFGLKYAKVLPQYSFSVKQWRESADSCLSGIERSFGKASLLIVRSSAIGEDGQNKSNAGAYLSLTNVQFDQLDHGIEKVIASYDNHHCESHHRKNHSCDNQVLVQPMLKNVIRSGVAFSHDPKTASPYHIYNWSDGEDTTMVTGGGVGHTWQSAACSSVPPPREIAQVCSLVDELTNLFQQPIDIEFAVSRTETGGEQVWLLQARPLVMPKRVESERTQTDRIQLISEKISQGMKPHPFLKGKSTIYGIMPDWNPAEIIGIRPKPLSLSLYKEVITDSIWAYQRHNYGYRNLRSFPLLIDYFGLPYIDVRVSFNSFIPAGLSDSLAEKLVDYYIEKLMGEPRHHDKVEFEIVHSCYTFDLHDRIQELKDFGFRHTDLDDLVNSLKGLTNRIIDPHKGLWKKDAAKLDSLKQRRARLAASDLDTIERIYWLLEDVKRYGTLPFAGLARAGFMAVQILRSLVAVGVLADRDFDCFMGSLHTVSGQLSRDRFTLGKNQFLAKYGHLRPGTYDILSPRYDETPDAYFDWSQKAHRSSDSPVFSLTLDQMKTIFRLMDTHDLSHDVVGLFDFIKSGIELREWSKFEFTRSISDVLQLIKHYGQLLDISEEDMAFCDISAFGKIFSSSIEPRKLLLNEIEQGKTRYEETMRTALPPLITRPEDAWSFYWPESTPSFITGKTVLASTETEVNPSQINGKIVFIPNADPGYDWLFTYPIAGLITAWGGMNSHMAIRAGELGIPAVIGSGQPLFHKWSHAKKICLYCAEGRVEIIA
ncbi:MAG: phosphoenolpyruvate synthase [Proteobacteria bacterium]|nr:MAG: phosphoenolpyruvate synthase [Pseudomonadota bacterium]